MRVSKVAKGQGAFFLFYNATVKRKKTVWTSTSELFRFLENICVIVTRHDILLKSICLN